MRTKALLVTAALGAVGIASVMADPVYSVNVVGFINMTVPAGGYALLGNQLNGTNNLVATIIPTFVQDGQLLTWDAAGQTFLQFFYDAGGGWMDGNLNPANPALTPGQGFFLWNAGATPYTVTFVGEVPQGTALNTTISPNYAMVASIPPLAGDVVSLGLPVAQDNQILKWDLVHQTYLQYFYDAGGGWMDGNLNPVSIPISVGEGFFVWNTGAAMQWTQNFSVQ
jgi:hypothetical protein